MTKLTIRRLLAMDMALNAMLAGMEGEGDWDPEVPARDLEAAGLWVAEQIRRRRSSSPERPSEVS